MIEAVALHGVLTLWFEGRTVNINVADLKLADVLEYIERKTGKRVSLLAGRFN